MEKKTKSTIANGLFAIVALFIIWMLAGLQAGFHRKADSPDEGELLEDELSPIDSIVTSGDSTLYFKKGCAIWFSVLD